MSLHFNGTGGLFLGETGSSSPFNLTLAYPFTISCWFFPTVAASQTDLVLLKGGADVYWLNFNGTGLSVSTWNGSQSATGTQSSVVTLNRWNQGMARFISNNQRFVQGNGRTGTVNSTSSNQATQVIDRLTLGVADNPQRFFTGYMAHVAIWDANLSDGDSASLGRGASPLTIRPQNLVAYWPLVNPGEQRNVANAKSRGQQPLPVFSAGTQAGPTITGVRYSNWNPPVKTVLPQRTRRTLNLVSSNQTVAVTGEALATTLGSVTVSTGDVDVAVTGEALATTLDSVTAAFDSSVAVTGEALATTLNSVTAVSSATVAVTGEALATTLGSVTTAFSSSVAVTGEALATTLGNVAATQNAIATPTGEALATTLDSVTVITDATVAVTGEALALTLGSVSITLDIIVDISSLTLSTELNSVDVVVDNTTLLTGLSSATTLESVTPISDATFLLTGLSASASVYDVTVTTSVSSFLLNMDLGYVTVWGVINDNQTPNWTPVVDTQGPSWGPIIDAQSPNWIEIE